MSGPKTSHYTLTMQQRRILQEQRRNKIEREMLKKQLTDTREVFTKTDQIIAQAERLYAEDKNKDPAALRQIRDIHDKVNIVYDQAYFMVNNSIGSTAELRKMNKELKNAVQKLTLEMKNAKSEYDAACKSFNASMANKIDAGFDFSFDMIEDSPKQSLMDIIQSKMDEMNDWILNAEQKNRKEIIRKQIDRIDDLDYLKTYYEMTIIPFEKECKAYHDAYEKQGSEYEYKRFVYESNVHKLGMEVQEIPFSLNAVHILDEKIKETEEAISYQEEQEYISQCVDEAMQEMGYTSVGHREVVRRNGKRFHNKLYLFDEGTAVNVTYANDGQITMELGGIGMEDRIPTDTESNSLAADMRTFCDDYSEIEQRLLKKGIITKRISLLPPEAEYAQIINVSGYQMDEEVAEYEAREEKRQSAQNTSRRMGE